MLAAGCQSASVAHPLTANLGGSAPEAQLEFWHTLNSRPVTSNDEAFHGLLLFLDSKDDSANYAQRVTAMKSRQLLPAGFGQPASEAVERGTLAVAICKALSIRGGWAMHVFGPTPRYCTRELEYLGLYPGSSPNQTFSGTEFLGIVGKMEDHQQERTAGAGATPAGPST